MPRDMGDESQVAGGGPAGSHVPVSRRALLEQDLASADTWARQVAMRLTWQLGMGAWIDVKSLGFAEEVLSGERPTCDLALIVRRACRQARAARVL